MADVLVVNAGEAAGLSGEREPAAAALALANRGAGSVVVTLGAAGVHLLSQGAHRHVPTPRVEPIDTTAFRVLACEPGLMLTTMLLPWLPV